jgi:hypothetical protein
MGRGLKVWRFSLPAKVRVEMFMQDCFGPRIKCPLLMIDMDQTTTACRPRAEGARCAVSVTT